MFRTIDDFVAVYGNLTAGTTKMMASLTDDALDQPVAGGHRTLGQIAWHIVATVPDMRTRLELGKPSMDPESPPPATAREIAAAYETVSREFLDAVRTDWTDDTLQVVDDLYGQEFARGETLSALIHHEIHHRGQMTVLLRQAGRPFPGTFGPSREEWSEYGMDAPPY